MKKTLIDQGMEPQQAAAMIAAYQKTLSKEREEAKNLLSVKDAAALLAEALESDWNEAKVRRFISSGDITPAMQPGAAKKLGYRISRTELERFVTEERMTKEDWKILAKQAQKELAEARQQLAKLQTAKPENQPSTAEDPNQVTLDQMAEGSKSAEGKRKKP